MKKFQELMNTILLEGKNNQGALLKKLEKLKKRYKKKRFRS